LDWNVEYEKKGRLWGDAPSELARETVKYLKSHSRGIQDATLLDIGCGYGRDSFYLSDQLGAHVIGIERAASGLALASKHPGEHRVSFICCDFMAMAETQTFGGLFASNLYHTMRPRDRVALRNKAARLLKPGGYFFLNALSVNDKEEYGKGDIVEGERHSFVKGKYSHFFTEDEIKQDFGGFRMQELYELEYEECRNEGRNHHHVSWIIILKKAG
jgi:SAM-dependent methyltransferase